MATDGYAADRPAAGRLPRAEFVLAALAVLSFALIPVHITTIYSNLPAHPLFLHVPVILIPIATIGALVLIARPAWFERYGVALAALTVVALAALFLTMGAGSALRDALHLSAGGFGPAALIARHDHAASILRLLFILFTAVLLATVLAHRIAGGLPVGRGGIDRLLGASSVRGLLRVALSVLALASAYFVFHTGDLGARAVWSGRLHQGGGGGGGFPGGFGFPGGGGGAGAGAGAGASGGASAP